MNILKPIRIEKEHDRISVKSAISEFLGPQI